MAKHGLENFEIKEIDRAFSKNHSIFLESFYIRYYKSNNQKYGYNLVVDDDGFGSFGISLEERIKRSKMSKRVRIKNGHKNKYVGVSYSNSDGKHGKNPWVCKILHMSRSKSKRFPTEQEAAEAYDKLFLFVSSSEIPPNFPENYAAYKSENLKEFFEKFFFKKPQKSEYRNVGIDRATGKFSARITTPRGNRIFLGLYEEASEAAQICDKIELYFRPDSKFINFPDKRKEYLREDLESIYLNLTTGIKQINRKTSSKYLGVNKNGKCWEWAVTINGRKFRGYCENETQAAICRDIVSIKAKPTLDINFSINFYTSCGIQEFNLEPFDAHKINNLARKMLEKIESLKKY